MAHIEINDSIRITLDSYSWALQRFNAPTKSSPEGEWRSVSWHATLTQAARAALEADLSDNDAMTVTTIEMAVFGLMRALDEGIAGFARAHNLPVAALPAQTAIAGGLDKDGSALIE